MLSIQTSAAVGTPSGTARNADSMLTPNLPPSNPPLTTFGIIWDHRHAFAAEIKKNFRLQSLRVHPDKHVGKLKGDAEEAFKKLSFAHEIMGDPDQRRQYEMERNEMAKQQYTEIEDYLRLLKERREEAKRNLFCGVCGTYVECKSGAPLPAENLLADVGGCGSLLLSISC